MRDSASRDFESAYKRDVSLASEAAGGNIARAVRNMQLERDIRSDPALRADGFVERWQKFGAQSQRHYQHGNMNAYNATRSSMGATAKSLERDPQMESILAEGLEQ